MKQVHFSRKTRQLKRLVKKLEAALKDQLRPVGRIERLKTKISNLLKTLNGVLSKAQLSRVLGSLAVFFGLSAINSAQAQYFTAPVLNPFGAMPNTNFLGSVEMVDIDADGDLDIIQGGYYGALDYFENTGTPTTPAFGSPVQNPFGLTMTYYYAFPTAADLDNDGDFDLLVAEYYGGMQYFENTGTVTAPAFAAPVPDPFGLSPTPYWAWPEFADLDGDGDIDLLVGQYYGDMLYFENTGTVSAPAFASPVTNPFGLQATYLIATPAFTDLDNDGDLDLLVGEAYGPFSYFENTGTVNSPAFAAPSTNPFGLIATTDIPFPQFADLDADGDADLMVSELYGTLRYFENINCMPAYGTDVQTACTPPFVWLDGNSYFVDNSTATYAIPGGAVNGCDSILTLNLTFSTPDVSVTVTDPTITANLSGAAYQWLDCSSGYTPTGATGQTFTAPANGDFAVEITDNGCVDTSACITISTVGLETEFFNGVSVYPNPTDGAITVNLGNLPVVNLRVLSFDGKVIYTHDQVSGPYYHFVFNEAPGVYFLEVIAEEQKKVFRVIRE